MDPPVPLRLDYSLVAPFFTILPPLASVQATYSTVKLYVSALDWFNGLSAASDKSRAV